MKTSSNNSNRGIVRGTISFITYCDYAYHSLRASLKNAGWFSEPQQPQGKKQLRASARLKTHPTKAAGAATPDAKVPGASVHHPRHKQQQHKALRGVA